MQTEIMTEMTSGDEYVDANGSLVGNLGVKLRSPKPNFQALCVGLSD
jgi:hypothetical protein